MGKGVLLGEDPFEQTPKKSNSNSEIEPVARRHARPCSVCELALPVLVKPNSDNRRSLSPFCSVFVNSSGSKVDVAWGLP
jgi:hypothetical protein